MGIHSTILAWKIPWTEKPGKAVVHGVAINSDTPERLTTKDITGCKECCYSQKR